MLHGDGVARRVRVSGEFCSISNDGGDESNEGEREGMKILDLRLKECFSRIRGSG
jgi:hypothetical protein